MAEHAPSEGDDGLIKTEAPDAAAAAAATDLTKPTQTDQASMVKTEPSSTTTTPSRSLTTSAVHSPHTQQMYAPGMPYGTPGQAPPPGYPPYPHHHPPPMAHHSYPPPPTAYWPPNAMNPPPLPPHTPHPSVPTHPSAKPMDRYPPEVEGRHGATSPSQIDASHKQDVEHMGCTCKKTRCLKLYCQCFGAKLYCGPNCRCMNCSNTKEEENKRQEAMRVILGRNPNAFDTKFQKAASEGNGATPTELAKASTPTDGKLLTHKTGCKCRKSACMKKYCECYAGSVKCTANCRCVGCKNMAPGEFPAMAYGGMPPVSVGGGGEATTMAPMAVAPTHAVPAAAPLPMSNHPFPHMHPGQVMQSAQAASQARSPPATTNGGMGQASAFAKQEQQPEGGVNALMLAAYAMTEFGQGSSAPGSTGKKRPKVQEGGPEEKRARMEM